MPLKMLFCLPFVCLCAQVRGELWKGGFLHWGFQGSQVMSLAYSEQFYLLSCFRGLFEIFCLKKQTKKILLKTSPPGFNGSIQSIGRGRVIVFESEASLVYLSNSRTVRAAGRDLVSTNKNPPGLVTYAYASLSYIRLCLRSHTATKPQINPNPLQLIVLEMVKIYCVCVFGFVLFLRTQRYHNEFLTSKIGKLCPSVVVHGFNPSTWEAEAGRSPSLRPAWSTEQVLGQPGLHRETLS